MNIYIEPEKVLIKKLICKIFVKMLTHTKNKISTLYVVFM